MAGYICLFTKDNTLFAKPMKSPLYLRMIVLVFAMAFGIYICSISQKQIGNGITTRFANVQVMQRPSVTSNKVEAVARVHYPNPETFSREECVQNPVRFFAIVSMQRSGSGWFETLLNSHVNISSNGEIFSPSDRRKNASIIIENLDKVYNLDWFTSASKNECSAAVGFKWMLNQGLMKYHEEIVDYFKRRGVSAIFLFRRNLLRRLVSLLANSYDKHAKLLNGTHKSHVHSKEEANALSSYKPTMNLAALMDNLREAEDTIRKALEYFKSTRHIVLFYEDLVKNRTMLKDVQEFLNVPLRELTSRQVKIHSGSLSQHIKNWDDVKRVLNGTEYEYFLRSDD